MPIPRTSSLSECLWNSLPDNIITIDGNARFRAEVGRVPVAGLAGMIASGTPGRQRVKFDWKG